MAISYNTYTIDGVRIHVAKGPLSNLKLLQVDGKHAYLSQLRYNGKKPNAIINCSYFDDKGGYAIGRNQGDVTQQTSSFKDRGWLGFAKTEDGFSAGLMEWWDVEKSDCGFSPATISILDGEDVELYTAEFTPSYDMEMKETRCESVLAINTENIVYLITAEKGLTGYKLLEWIKGHGKWSFVCNLDNGGSTEMIYAGEIKQKSLDGNERLMYNGLALIEEEEPLKLRYPCEEGWDSQAYRVRGTLSATDSGHYALDFGWWSKYTKDGHSDILACADGVVEYEGYYDQTFSSGKVRPIGVLIRHTQFSSEYDYISIYWHLSSTVINKGDTVKAGQKIGVKGSTGFSGGIHLHFQILKLKKGEAIPDQHYPSKADNWAKYSIDPTKLIYVSEPEQHFLSTGNFDLKRVEEEFEEDEKFDYKTEYEIIKEEFELLASQIEYKDVKINELSAQVTKLTEDINKLNECIETALNVLASSKV